MRRRPLGRLAQALGLMTHALLLAALLVGTASEPQSAPEEVFSKVATDPIPACGPGRTDALANGALTIMPGQTVCISVQARGDSVVPVAVVSAYTPDTTLVIRFWQEPEAGDTYLAVYNPLDGLLQYQAAMRLPDSLLPKHTSTCPVLSRRRGIERWPHPVATLVLSDFKLLADSASMTCQ